MTAKTKITLIAISSVLIALILIFGIGNTVFAILGSKPQKGILEGDEWSVDSEFNINNISSLDMGQEDFKILCLADLQRKNSGTAVKFLGINLILDAMSDPKIKKLVKNTSPDLIILLGDNMATHNANDLELKHIAKMMDAFGIPWAVIFGNHDEEGRADKSRLSEILAESSSLYKFGPKDLHGAGNYVVNLTRNEQIEYSLFMMDSGNHIETTDGSKYDGINTKQVEWYKWNMAGINAAANKQVKNMAFFHIPLPEYATIQDIYLGSKSETPSASYYNSGFFDTFKQNNGTHIIVGHDHNNNFIGKLDGVKIGYGQKSSYNSYYKSDKLGGTLITIAPDNSVTENLVNFK